MSLPAFSILGYFIITSGLGFRIYTINIPKAKLSNIGKN
jgi:hypothetical protein